MKRKEKVLLVFVLFLVGIFLISGCHPIEKIPITQAGCEIITEGLEKDNYFYLLNQTHFLLYNTAFLVLDSNICEYSLLPAFNIKYSGIDNTDGLLHYRTPCLSLYGEMIVQDIDGQKYICRGYK
ncbi:MAG: hypothetical protein KAK00_07115 [Nanoarchaeota archaeon]|nr:hypothetical protein [Nanoarchaeota archaeon]